MDGIVLISVNLVKYIGEASKEQQNGLVLASFNAG